MNQTRSDEASRTAMPGGTRASERTAWRDGQKRLASFRTVLIIAALSTGLHLVLGWAWTIAAGILGGFLRPSRGASVGAFGVGSAWTILLAYTFFIAPASTAILLDVLAGLLGRNTPGALVVFLTMLFGVILGALGGTIGSQLRMLFGSGAPVATQSESP